MLSTEHTQFNGLNNAFRAATLALAMMGLTAPKEAEAAVVMSGQTAEAVTQSGQILTPTTDPFNRANLSTAAEFTVESSLSVFAITAQNTPFGISTCGYRFDFAFTQHPLIPDSNVDLSNADFRISFFDTQADVNNANSSLILPISPILTSSVTGETISPTSDGLGSILYPAPGGFVSAGNTEIVLAHALVTDPAQVAALNNYLSSQPDFPYYGYTSFAPSSVTRTLFGGPSLTIDDQDTIVQRFAGGTSLSLPPGARVLQQITPLEIANTVPEPSRAALLGLGTAALLLGRKKE